ncbi:MAG TPA: hypothetical protein VEK39_02995 [Solirubrobacterales bacterium]|nr:hypothetical protein [Solirubrobacterales bacterium]
MARVVALAPDLMFGSRIETVLGAAGHDVTLAASAAEAPLGDADLLIADLERVEPEAVVGLGIPVLGFYRHTDPETREQAEAAGVDRVVPRSRMAREMPELVAALLDEAG